MPAELHRKLAARYGADSKIPYKIMNARGLMPHKNSGYGKHKVTISDLMKRK